MDCERGLADTSAYDISKFTKRIGEIGLTMPVADASYATMFLSSVDI